MRNRISRRRNLAAALAAALTVAIPAVAAGAPATASFKPLASFNVPDGGVAEIVSASPDGNTLVYTDAGSKAIGLVDITDPASPTFLAGIDMGGEPTSVSVTKDAKAIVAVRRDALEEGEAPELLPGHLAVVDLATRTVERTIEIGHHPDSVATGTWKGTPFAVVAIENEPVVVDGDGNLTDEEEPGDPGDISGPGLVQVVDLADGTVHDVPIPPSGRLEFKTDPQPEFVDLHGRTAVVSLQENNGYATIDVGRALQGKGAQSIRRIFGAGKASDRKADLADDDTVSFTDTYPRDVGSEPYAGLRFPDSVGFSANGRYVLSADEGEFDFTGGRGWSIRSARSGRLVWQDGGSLEREAVKAGQYPDGRSDAKGTEIEGMEVATFDGREFAFVGSERGSFVAVYRLFDGGRKPKLVQLLPTGVEPEGILALPGRDLLVASNEGTGDLTIYMGVPYRYTGAPERPVAASKSYTTPWSAVSGLAGDPTSARVLWGVPDVSMPSQLYRFALRGGRALVTTPLDITKDGERVRYDLEGVVPDTSVAARSVRATLRVHRRSVKRARARYLRAAKAGRKVQARRAKRALNLHRAKLRHHVRYGFWLAQEGNAAFGEEGYRPNLLIQVDHRGRVTREIPLPTQIDSPGGGVIRSNGFEGVTLSDDGRYLLAAVQRQYGADVEVGGALHTRIARYDLKTGEWDFFLYPLDGPVADGWVGLSEIVNLGDDRYAVIERDQQVGGAAEVKRIYEFTLDGVEPTDGSPLEEGTTPEDVDGKVIEKILYADATEEFGPFEKLEGLALTQDRQLWGNVDNDGGLHETRLRSLGEVSPAPQDLELTVLHNNDGESDLLAGTDKGSVAQFATLVDQEKVAATSGPSPVRRAELMISAGDNSLAGKVFNAGLAKGVPFYDSIAMDLIGYDAVILGNHDFDQGPEVLADFIRGFQAKTSGAPARSLPPFLSSNLDLSGEPDLDALEDEGRIAKSTVVSLRGQRVGIIGATTPTLPFISSPRNVAVSPDVLGAVQSEVAKLKGQGVNKIILSSHLQGISEDQELVTHLRDVDVLIAGGGDELLANPDDALLPGDVADPAFPYPLVGTDADGKQVPIVTTAGNYKYLGKLVLRFDRAGEIEQILDESGPVANPPAGAAGELAPDPEVQEQVIDPVSATVAEIDANVVATSAVALDGTRNAVRGKETNLGNLIADATLAKARELGPASGVPEVQIAVQNGGGIRNNSVIPAGDLTEGLTFDILPFGNTVAVVRDMTPEEIKALMENSVAFVERQPDGSLLPTGEGTGRFAQIAGFTLRYDVDAAPRTYDDVGNLLTPGERVLDVTLEDGTKIVENGTPVSGAPSLNVAMPDFNANGGDQYPTAGKEIVLLGVTGQAAFSQFLQGLGGPVGSAADSPYAEGVNERIVAE